MRRMLLIFLTSSFFTASGQSIKVDSIVLSRVIEYAICNDSNNSQAYKFAFLRNSIDEIFQESSNKNLAMNGNGLNDSLSAKINTEELKTDAKSVRVRWMRNIFEKYRFLDTCARIQAKSQPRTINLEQQGIDKIN